MTALVRGSNGNRRPIDRVVLFDHSPDRDQSSTILSKAKNELGVKEAVSAMDYVASDAMLAVYDRPGELFSGSAGAYFEGV